MQNTKYKRRLAAFLTSFYTLLLAKLVKCSSNIHPSLMRVFRNIGTPEAKRYHKDCTHVLSHNIAYLNLKTMVVPGKAREPQADLMILQLSCLPHSRQCVLNIDFNLVYQLGLNLCSFSQFPINQLS